MYKNFIVDVGKLLFGDKPVIRTKAQEIIDFETELEGVSSSNDGLDYSRFLINWLISMT